MLLATRNGELEVVGFFVTKRIEASTGKEAEVLAKEAVKNDGYILGASSELRSELLVKVVHELPANSEMKSTVYVFF